MAVQARVEVLEKQVEDVKSALAGEVESQAQNQKELVLLRGELRRRNDELKMLQETQVY